MASFGKKWEGQMLYVLKPMCQQMDSIYLFIYLHILNDILVLEIKKNPDL